MFLDGCTHFLATALDFPVRLRIVGRSSDVRHPRDTNELLEVASDELWPVVRDDPWSCIRVALLGSFDNYFDVSLPHRLSETPVHEETTVPTQHTAQVVERRAHIDVRKRRYASAGVDAAVAQSQSPCATAWPSIATTRR